MEHVIVKTVCALLNGEGGVLLIGVDDDGTVLDADPLRDMPGGRMNARRLASARRVVLAVREVTPADGIRAGRLLRRWYRAKGLTRRIRRQRVDQATGRVIFRSTTARKVLFTQTAVPSPLMTAP